MERAHESTDPKPATGARRGERARVAERLAVRLRAAGLDRALAAGARPDDGAALRLRAASLIDASMRDSIATELRRVAREATEGRGLTARIPTGRAAVAAAGDELRLLAARLQAPGPVAAPGVAQARLLLTDGRGPLYDPNGADRLRSAARNAIAALRVP